MAKKTLQKMQREQDRLRDRILQQIRRIPSGSVATYGQIAALVDRPRNARQVGSVLRSLDDDADVPWHRVVNACGQISERRSRIGAGGSVELLQQALLEAEGVRFDEERRRIDLKQYRWQPT